MWVRGLKRKRVGKLLGLLRSHPMWVRGLKLSELAVFCFQRYGVAPHVGAWIETALLAGGECLPACRTPCGCVD